MKAGHLTRRRMRARGRFGWCRVPCSDDSPLCGAVEWRLFLRDEANVSHAEIRTFTRADFEHRGRDYVARVLRGMRAQLRWRVDQLDFARIGLEDTTPPPAAATVLTASHQGDTR